MRKILHLLTRAERTLPDGVIATQKQNPQFQIEVIDFNQAEPDYRQLLEKIFEADSIEVW